ncbi:MAG: DUF2914 domain-containing protein [Parcubacteria group bacterium]|nr:DUF2914 domain-containing protein [Parcubacteria group bacterium]
MKKVELLANVQKGKTWFVRHERRLSSAALILGFFADTLTLKRVDLAFEQIVIVTHLLIVATCIALINFYEREAVLRGSSFVHRVIPLLMQFSFGALFSGFFIFYTKSASLVASWPFLLFLLALLVGNEFLRARYQRLVFQVSLFYFVLFSFVIFYVPIVIGALGAEVFLFSGAVSLALIAGFVLTLALFIPQRIAESKRFLVASIATIFVVVNTLYFANIIPPIPLSLKGAEVAYQVRRLGYEYEIRDEKESWLTALLPFETMHITPHAPVFFYSSIFAPTDLATSIVHEWEHYEEGTGEWVVVSRVPFPIFGGRDGGYRGYSLIENLASGRWRVNVKTERGQLLGRAQFVVEYVSQTPQLVTKYGE